MAENFNIVKRNGTKEEFSVDKVKNAIKKAFKENNKEVREETIDDMIAQIKFYDGMNVEEIQNQVEISLMEWKFYDIAKSFMIYRKKHKDDRDTLDKFNFLVDYCDAKNAASGSKYDANANVENKNIATLIGELPKSDFIRLNRRMLTNKIKEIYGKDIAEKYLDLLENHFIYKNDETNMANYCASITMYPWLLDGTMSIGGNSKAPTNLKSFCGGFINMVFMVSSMLSGACATPEFLMYLNYFIGLEYGEDYYKRADEIVDMSFKKRTIDKVITDCFEQIVYSINQPTGARNFQAVFWNIAYYDKNYFNSLFGDFVFPNGKKPDWESLSWLQKRFMTWFNEERTKAVLTFPVESMSLLSKDGDVLDEEYADFTAKMYAEGHSFFTYMSDNVDSLSSCCFKGDTKVIFNCNGRIYNNITFEDAYNKYSNGNDIKVLYVDTKEYGEKWVDAKFVKATATDSVRITYKNLKGENTTIEATHDHYFPTQNKGMVRAEMLEKGDALFLNDGYLYVRTIEDIKEVHYETPVDFYCFTITDESIKVPVFQLNDGLCVKNCRLRNEINNNGFSYTLGAGGVSTGSKSVLTINLNRTIQYAVKNNIPYMEFLEDIVDLVHKAQNAYNENLKALYNKGMLPLFKSGYITMNRQYLTIGVNGLVEAAEFLGIKINDNPDYAEFVQNVLGLVEKYNKKYCTNEVMFNCEMIPAENVGVKHAKWDREAGYMVNRDCYNSYFYIVEDDTLNIIDKFRLHGEKYIKHLTGGSALHMNLEEHLTQKQYRQLLRVAAKEGCNYFTFNIPNTICNDCGNIDKRYLKKCPKCGSENVDYLTRIIGYMKRVSNFSAARQKEAARRYYAKMK